MKTRPLFKMSMLTVAGCAVLAIAGCGDDYKPADEILSKKQQARAKPGVTGDASGFTIFGDRNRKGDQQGGGAGGIGVNTYLWRASLDTIGFMPLSSADPFGGVIITDWYASPDVPNERFKITVYVLDRELRADGIKAAIFKQSRDMGGNWVDAAVDPKMINDLENGILTRARQMRLDQAAVK